LLIDMQHLDKSAPTASAYRTEIPSMVRSNFRRRCPDLALQPVLDLARRPAVTFALDVGGDRSCLRRAFGDDNPPWAGAPSASASITPWSPAASCLDPGKQWPAVVGHVR
jgi:signal transduction protein with GAF and PtsI domain